MKPTLFDGVVLETNLPVTAKDRVKDEPADLAELLSLKKDEVKSEMNCMLVGTVQTFYSSTQTADVTVNYKRIVGQNIVEYPVLLKCPVIFLGGGDGSLTFKVVAGDTCLVLFNDRTLDLWWTQGGNVAPDSERMHDLSDGIVIVGVRSMKNLLSNFFSGTELKDGDATIQLVNGVSAKMEMTDGSVFVNSTTAKMEVSGGAVVTATQKVHIASQAQSLAGALLDLVDAIKAWVGTDPQGGTVAATPATIVALNAVAVEIGAVLS